VVLEKGPQFLSKVRISGGGRCNLTHACFDPRDLATRYPRGEKALIAPFRCFQPRDTIRWFESRGVPLKVEGDGRMFPSSDTSQTILDCLQTEARKAGVIMTPNCGVDCVERRPEGGFDLTLSGGDKLTCGSLLLATGGCRTIAAGRLAVALGHELEAPVPSLFTFEIKTSWVRELAGVAVNSADVSIPGSGLREKGPLLFTHWGMSGPTILRLSAWGARILSDQDYHFPLRINWLPDMTADAVAAELQRLHRAHPARLIVNTSVASLPARLWEQLVLVTGLSRETPWSRFSKSSQHALIQQLIRTELAVTGKSLNKDEFVTCGGVKLSGVNFKTMESRICPGLYFSGELLDIDGLTGGMNLQAAWTTGWIAGRSMAGAPGS